MNNDTIVQYSRFDRAGNPFSRTNGFSGWDSGTINAFTFLNNGTRRFRNHGGSISNRSYGDSFLDPSQCKIYLESFRLDIIYDKA